MTITFNTISANQLSEGIHRVKISQVTHGKSSKAGVPYFKCRFENQDGYIYNKFYITEPSKVIIKRLFEAVGIFSDTVNTNELNGRELFITVKQNDMFDNITGEVLGVVTGCIYYQSVNQFTHLKQI